MGTLLNRRRYMGGKPSAQMVDIEYLQSDGNQWMELGIYGSNDLDFTIDFEPLDLTETNRTWTGTGSYFGTYKPTSNTGYHFLLCGYNRSTTSKGTFMYRTNGEAQGSTTQMQLSAQRVTVKKIGTTLQRPVSNATLPSDVFTTTTTMVVFADKKGTSIEHKSKMKLYSLKFEKDDVTLLDLVPVRVGQVGCLYDKVSGKLFENETSTPFILGPDKT